MILAIASLVVGSFSVGYTLAQWQCSGTYVRLKVEKRLEKELRARCELCHQMTMDGACEIIENTNEAIRLKQRSSLRSSLRKEQARNA